MSSEQAILELEKRRYQAMIDGDVSVLGDLLSEDLVYTHSQGERDTKASYLEKVRTGFFVYHSIDHPVEKLTVTDSCAIVVGQMRATVLNNGQPKKLDNSSLAVWIRQDSDWQLAAYQPTPNP